MMTVCWMTALLLEKELYKTNIASSCNVRWMMLNPASSITVNIVFTCGITACSKRRLNLNKCWYISYFGSENISMKCKLFSPNSYDALKYDVCFQNICLWREIAADFRER